ncbi:Gfo/Idh/MocA family oxidoreductase [Bacillus sp. FJAT-50079]|uniref:Gfo/Idh/MocA family protein n=1 Tax=Bacillus sp. FJAT-50079 TaxID=2833577 RepID=UPI001BCA2139|nr:Gfo/Idh/MocA family oxidoreductase [Bacillus sp. FJAT-50079]MBS4206966.1 Gfo/Idh/MocA family oxidoreductase [Bacillus sp. FJAT-50079]
MKRHTFILIGHGVISKAYLKAIAATKNAKIVGVVGRNQERVAAFAKEHHIPAYGTSLEAVAKISGATAVAVCTPNALHYDGVMEAARLGLHCLCEKPLHISPAMQEEMIAACEQNGVKLGVSYMRRYIDHIMYLKELIDSGKLGRIMVADVIIKHFRDEKYYATWHGTNEFDGGGPFLQQGSHIVDMIQWLCGGYKEVLAAKRFQVLHDIETEDHGYAVIQYNNGAVGMIEASTASIGMKEERVEISGTKGTIVANYSEITTFDVPGVEKPIFNPANSVNERLFEKLVFDFVEAIDTDRDPFISGKVGKEATELVIDIYEKAGEPIRTFANEGDN